MLWLLAMAFFAVDGAQAGGERNAPTPEPVPDGAAATTAGPPVSAERATEPAARRVTEIRWRGLAQVPEATALFHLGIEPGRPLDPAVLNRALHRLWASGLFEDLEMHTTPDGAGGVTLEVRVVERPRLAGIDLEGFDWATREETEAWLAERGFDRRQPGALDRGRLTRLATELETRVRQRGRRRGTVRLRFEPVGDGLVRAVFTLERRPAVRLEAIEFKGNQVFGSARLRRALRHNRPPSPLARLLRRNEFDPEGLEADLDALRALYRDHGYKDVVVFPPRVERLPGDGAPQRVRVTIRLHEGERWTLGGLSVSGNRVFSDQRLLGLFERPRGERLEHSALEAWRAAIETLYRRQGRLAIRVALELVERPGRVADAVARVAEGPEVRLRRLEFAGNTRTEERVLRRELPLAEGEPLDVVALRAGIERIERAGLFVFDEDPVTLREVDEGAADVVLEGREAKPLRTSFGGGWSETDGFSTHVALGTPNLLGRGVAAGLRLERGGTRDGVELSLTQPWVFDRPQALGLELFDRRTDDTLPSGQRIARDERGGALGWVRTLGRHQTLRLRYTRASLTDLQTGADADGAEIRRASRLDSSALRAAWALDRRDDPLAPRRGFELRAALEVAGGALGGDRRFVRPELAFSFHRPLTARRHGPGLALRLAGGRIDARGSQPLPPLDTYFLGGSHSLRGFANRSIAPRDDAGLPLRDEAGFVLGGKSYLETGVEAHLPLGGPFEAVLFFDAGDTWAAGQTVDLSSFRSSAGAELRIALPRIGLPLRLIWAANLDPLPGDRFDELSVAFGGGF